MTPAYSLLPSIIGHRGSSGMAPENTLAALHLAGQQGVKWVEVDVTLSADGIPIIFHDETLDRTTNGEGLVVKQVIDDLKQLDAGSWKHPQYKNERIPTLLEAIQVISLYGMGLNLEIKPCEGMEDETVEATVAVLKANWPSNLPLLLSSFNYFALAKAYEAWPEIQRAYNVSAIPSNWQERLELLDCSGLHIHHPFFDAAKVAVIKQAGYKVVAFTVNNETLAEQLFTQGLDAIFTDYPEQLLQHFQQDPNQREILEKP